jgi:hypothetical protein
LAPFKGGTSQGERGRKMKENGMENGMEHSFSINVIWNNFQNGMENSVFPCFSMNVIWDGKWALI